MAERSPWLADHFKTLEQQSGTETFGMWVFLMTELMLFGGLFLGYTAYRLIYPDAWTEGSRHLNVLIGSVNTVVLLISSVTMALAVQDARIGNRKWLTRNLLLTAGLGAVFMALKALEYYQHFQEHMVPAYSFDYQGPNARAVELFFYFYFVMTGVHAIHLTIAVLVVLVTFFWARRGALPPERFGRVASVGLYWHFVDMVWIFLLPLLYLSGRAG
ncbi:MAG TPA: cytochrome c oxidase subunit 3 [Chloroflexota bacterium]|jgi:cytochrome c oxidase subunit 3|nr:cytochrome c oxidase subunit 3 [Chloroflexota bacterium]